MHRSAAWGLAALAAGALPATAADPDKPADKPGLVSRWFGSSGKRPDAEKTFADAPARPPVVVGPLDPAVQAEALKAEQDAWRRRMDVCLRLKAIADKLNDDKLLQQADELERQATALYHQRAARLGVKAPLRGPADALEGKLTVAAPEPAEEPAAARTRQFREVKP